MNGRPNPFRIAALLLPAAILAAAPQAPEPADDETYQGEAPERYAMVRALEGEVRIRKGDLEEALTRGTPVSEGDVVESRGRGVLQLGDGTRVAFGGATRFTVAALFTDQAGVKQVLLRLDYGRLRVLMAGQSGTRFRVDTPSGTAKGSDRGGFSLEAEPDRLVRVKVHSGRLSFSNERDEIRLGAGERLTVYSAQDSLDRVRSFNTYEGDEFDRWSDRAVVVQRGESWDRVPAEIRYYADDLDNHGRWIQSDEFGWVWQPSGLAEDWRPYTQGRWAPYAGGLTWISDEPWAYVAYHHGRWHWSLGIGWCWIPGVNYSPAWVAWNRAPGYCAWAPLGYYNTPCHWGYGAWGGGYAWNVVSIEFINVFNIHTRIHADSHRIGLFGGGRDLHAPWLRSPLMVSHAEFRNPGQLHGVFERDLNRQRLDAYDRHAQTATGRGVIRRELRPPGPGPADVRPGSPVTGPARPPFEERRLKIPEGITPRERTPEGRPVDRGRELGPVDRRPDPTPRERIVEPHPRTEERRPDFTPRPEGREARPQPERTFDVRPERRERSPEPRPEPRIREERRPDPQPRPEGREARPAPKTEAPKDKPREEKKGDRDLRR